MAQTTNWTRRHFVSATLAVGGVSARSANDRIQLGVIGAGGRGSELMRQVAQARTADAVITAICDVYRPNRERAAEFVEKTWKIKPRLTTEYKELLGWPDVDAVIIAAPDFAHSVMLKDAVEAGKDVYCEKPMGVDFAEAKAAYLAVRRSDRVVQIGTQRRSEPRLMGAARLVRSGLLGQVTRVEFSVNFQEPRWRRDYSHIRPEDVAWPQFLMHRPARPFDARRFREWQLFRDYTNGIPGLWMSHFIDLVHWFLDDPYPAGAVANGGVYLWKDGRETSDVFHALLDYPKGFLVSFAMSLTNAARNRNLWFGTRGTLDAEAMKVTGEGSRMPDRITEEIEVPAEPANSHMENFLECVRTRRTPRADIQAGFSHTVACCMAALALDYGRKVRFDRERLELIV
ncbi:MAG: Gfo/Idh/MocA family oxidoreductase [Bryobacterales bacterium]|nr:Gfo/Idh/MocA family oxidoreductase [Bryobacteraceae bacterium]MDW8130490.1 Gfo/Idh/MocA family oxidoreductase [Bryobacterales bacterium]